MVTLLLFLFPELDGAFEHWCTGLFGAHEHDEDIDVVVEDEDMLVVVVNRLTFLGDTKLNLVS